MLGRTCAEYLDGSNVDGDEIAILDGHCGSYSMRVTRKKTIPTEAFLCNGFLYDMAPNCNVYNLVLAFTELFEWLAC